MVNRRPRAPPQLLLEQHYPNSFPRTPGGMGNDGARPLVRGTRRQEQEGRARRVANSHSIGIWLRKSSDEREWLVLVLELAAVRGQADPESSRMSIKALVHITVRCPMPVAPNRFMALRSTSDDVVASAAAGIWKRVHVQAGVDTTREDQA